jgi:hypothetical protein
MRLSSALFLLITPTVRRLAIGIALVVLLRCRDHGILSVGVENFSEWGGFCY